MESLSDKNKTILYLYYLMEGILFFLIKWAEYSKDIHTGKIMYSAIVLNTLVLFYFFWGGKGDRRIPLALFVTLIADYILTYRNDHFFVGVLVFVLVQIIYGWRIGYDRRNVGLRITIFFLFTGLMWLLGMNLSFCIICGANIAILSGNVIVSFFSWRQGKEGIPLIFVLGITLFAGCDLSIGLRIISSGSEELLLFHDVMNYLTWTFYIPAQVLLNLSYILYDRNQ